MSKYMSDATTQNMITQSFKPSKTAQNCLNFITKNEELQLLNIDISDKNIMGIIRAIYVLVKEEEKLIPNENLVSNLIMKILPKHKVDSISKY